MRNKLTILLAAVAIALGLAAAPAAAQSYPGPDVGGAIIEQPGPPSGPAQVVNPTTRQQQQPQPQVTRQPAEVRGLSIGGARLPVTGGDVVALVALGAGAIAVGAGLMAARRRGLAAA